MEVSVPVEKLCCPRCGSSEISRSRPRGVMEKHLGNLMHLRPYRCYECSLRFWKRRSTAPAPRPELQVEAPQSFF